MEAGTIIAIIKASLTTIDLVRNSFPKVVQQQLDMAETYLKSAQNENEMVYAIQVMETAVNLISRSKWIGPLYFMGNEKEKNIEKYNSLCRTIAHNHHELGNSMKASYWYQKLIDEYWNEPGYNPLNVGTEDYPISPADMANGG